MMSLLPIFVLLGTAVGHTITSKPEPRDPKNFHGYNTQECGNSREVKHSFQRGEVIDLEWARNNHQGGFVQYSVMPLSSSDPNRDIKEFDDLENIVYVTCYDKPSCPASGGGDDLGLGGDGMSEWSNICRDTLTIPNWLKDGEYVMKSSVYGNGGSYGIRNMAHPTYGNCFNFRVSGGDSLVSKPSNSAHIQWNLNDPSIDRMNSRKGWNVAQGQCMFLASNRHQGCSCSQGCTSGGRNPKCTGPAAEVSRCGEGSDAETWHECFGGSGGDELYNYMVGLPMHHPEFTGKLTMLREKKGLKEIQIDVPQRKKPVPEPDGGSSGNGGSSGTGDVIVLISLGAQTVVSMCSMLPLLTSAILLLIS